MESDGNSNKNNNAMNQDAKQPPTQALKDPISAPEDSSTKSKESSSIPDESSSKSDGPTSVPEASISKESTPTPKTPSSKHANIFQRLVALFSKTNPHYMRNRWILLICLFALIGIIAAIIIFVLLPSMSGELSILNVQPTSINDDILSASSHFVITTENGSVDKLRNALYLEPAIDYEVKELTPGASYEIIPASELSDNTLFNIDSVSDGVVSYKWAFQTKKDLSVSKIYPANGANYVSENTVIEFSFSYPNIENVAEHFSISPQVSGNLEQLERSWRFTPDAPLAKDTTYEITITAGLSYGEEIMTKDFHSSFSTFAHSVASSDSKSKGITIDGVSYFTTAEAPVVSFSGEDQKLLNDGSYISVERINNVDDFIKHLQGEQISGEIIGDYGFEIMQNSGYIEKYAVLNQTLPTGYYVLHLKSNAAQNLYTTDIEVNDLAAYAFESEQDGIVWVAENGELKAGIKVNYKGQDYETGDNGLLRIDNISNYSDNLDYLKIGSSDQPLAIAFENFKNNLYPRGFIYTDRPLYTPNDTIKVWGYIPLAFFNEPPKLDAFSIVLDEIKKQVTIDSEGFFSSEIKLENYKDYYGNISLNYNDQQLATRYLSIENYTLENYTYEFISSKNYLYAGENIDFTIKVSHVTGFPAINKDIVVTYQNHDYFGTTNGAGEVSFSFPTEHSTATWENASNFSTEWVSVKSGGAEYNKYSTSTVFYIFKNNLLLNGEKIKNANTVKFTANTVDLSESVKTDYSYKNLAKAKYSGPATVRFYEDQHRRYINGSYYDEYTKENVPTYHFDTVSSVVSEITGTFVDGELVVEYPTEFKNPEKDIYYSYRAVVSATDTTSRPAYSYGVTYHENYYLGESTNYRLNNAIDVWGYNPTSSSLYNLYRFGLKDTTSAGPYSIDDKLELGLYDCNGDTIENTGHVLAIVYKERIISTDIFANNTLDVTFNQKLYPNAELAGSYFINGKFYRIAPKTIDYDESDSELTISIETDKDSYSPGETVKAKLIITHQDGSRANGKVNLSVVNEAIFSATEDNTSILSSIYTNKSYKSYAVSTYRDYELLTGGGGRGGGGGGRSDFGDTIFFEDKNYSNGELEFEFKLNDAITSFRITALAVESGDIINAGTGTTKVTSSLPLSISTVIPKKVKNTDDLVINATSITSVGDIIDYTFTIEELNESLTASAAPGQPVSVNFGKLELGNYTINIAAQDSAGNTDKMTYPIEIIETAQEITVKKTERIDHGLEITPAKNPIIIELFDEETKRYLTYQDFLEANHTVRLDTLVSYYKSLEYKNKYYNEESTVRVPSFDSYMLENGSLKPLENAEGDYILTALANYYMPTYFNLKPENYSIDLNDDISMAIQKLLVLSSFKSPVLLDLKAAATAAQDNINGEDGLLLGIAFAFIGDYNSAGAIYKQLDRQNVSQDLLAILSSFISKNTAASRIDYLIENEPSSDYLPFAIISFFENNEVDTNNESTVNVTVNNETKSFTVRPLEVLRHVYRSDNLLPIGLATNVDTIFAEYYYQGGIAELGDNYAKDIKISIENPIVGQNATLILDISALDNRNGTLDIALPSNLKYSATFSGQDGLYLIRNNNEYIKLSLTDYYKDNTISIPFYVAAPGNYVIEPVIFTGEDGYHISENVVFDAK